MGSGNQTQTVIFILWDILPVLTQQFHVWNFQTSHLAIEIPGIPCDTHNPMSVKHSLGIMHKVCVSQASRGKMGAMACTDIPNNTSIRKGGFLLLGRLGSPTICHLPAGYLGKLTVVLQSNLKVWGEAGDKWCVPVPVSMPRVQENQYLNKGDVSVLAQIEPPYLHLLPHSRSQDIGSCPALMVRVAFLLSLRIQMLFLLAIFSQTCPKTMFYKLSGIPLTQHKTNHHNLL